MRIAWRKYLPEEIQAKLRGKENFINIGLNSFWLLSDRIIRMVVNLIVGAWTARYLGTEQYGIFNNALAFATIFIAFSSLGIESILIRELVKHPEKRSVYLGTAFLLKLVSGFFAFIISLIGIFIFYESYSIGYKNLIILICAGTLFQPFEVVDYYFQSITNSKYTIVAKNSMFLLISIVKVYLILSEANLQAFAWAWLGETILIACSLAYIYQLKEKNLTKWRWETSFARYLLKESFAIYITYLAAFIYMRIDQVLISKMLDNNKAGEFAASTKIYEIPFFIIVVLTTSFYPSLIRLYQNHKELFYFRYKQITQGYTILGILIFISTILFGSFVIKMLYGNAFNEAYKILTVQMIGILFLFNAGLRSSYFTIISKQKIIMFTTVVSVITNIGLNLVLIPKIGVIGSALATVITQFLSLYLLNFIFKDSRSLFTIQSRAFLMLDLASLQKIKL